MHFFECAPHFMSLPINARDKILAHPSIPRLQSKSFYFLTTVWDILLLPKFLFFLPFLWAYLQAKDTHCITETSTLQSHFQRRGHWRGLNSSSWLPRKMICHQAKGAFPVAPPCRASVTLNPRFFTGSLLPSSRYHPLSLQTMGCTEDEHSSHVANMNYLLILSSSNVGLSTPYFEKECNVAGLYTVLPIPGSVCLLIEELSIYLFKCVY